MLRWSVLALVVGGAAVWLARGANGPADPVLVDPSTGVAPGVASPDRRPLEGFGELAFQLRNGTEVVEDLCALLADDLPSRAQGLRGQTDLRGYDGMIFRYDADTDTAFVMESTPLPLSIAWFDASGALVAATDMEPCLGRGSCPLYRPPVPYRLALEVPRGALEDLGVGRGTVIEGGGRCR